MKYGNRSLWKKIIASPLTLIGMVFLFIILAKASWGIFEKTHLSSDRLIKAQAELVKLQERHKVLSSKVEALSTEQGIEKEIRTKYHAVKEGESVAVIIDESNTAATASITNVQASTTIGWWKRMIQFLGF